MRRFLVVALLLSLAVSAAAQDLSPVTCPDGTAIKPQVTVTLPSQPLTAPDDVSEPYFVSVLTQNDVPTLAATDDNFVVTCATPDGLSEGVSINESLGSEATMYGLSPYSAWVSSDTSVNNTVSLGQIAGTTAIIIEGGQITSDDKNGDLYTLSIEPKTLYGGNGSMIDVPLRIDVLGIDDSYMPGVSVVDDNGEVVQQENIGPVICIPTECTGSPSSRKSYTGLRVPSYTTQDKDVAIWLPTKQQSTFHIRVENTKTTGAYTLIVAFDVPTPEAPVIRAQPIPNGDGAWTLRCNSRMAFEGGIKVDLSEADISAEHPLTLTAIGSDSAISIAVMTSETEGYCVQPGGAAGGYTATLPDLEATPSGSSAQVVLTEAPAYLVIGSLEVRPITLVLEGWQTPLRETLTTDDTASLDLILQPFMSLEISPGMRTSELRAYALAGDDKADPAIGIMGVDHKLLTDETGRIIACDNAGVPDQCPLNTTSLNGYTATIADGRVLPGASLDAMVRYNLSPDTAPQPSLVLAAADRTGAGGPLVLLVSFSLGL